MCIDPRNAENLSDLSRLVVYVRGVCVPSSIAKPGLLQRHRDQGIFVLDHEHQKFGRPRLAGVAADGMNVVTTFIKCLSGRHCDRNAAVFVTRVTSGCNAQHDLSALMWSTTKHLVGSSSLFQREYSPYIGS